VAKEATLCLVMRKTCEKNLQVNRKNVNNLEIPENDQDKKELMIKFLAAAALNNATKKISTKLMRTHDAFRQL